MLRHLYDIEILATVIDHTMYKMQIVIDFIENRGGFDENVDILCFGNSLGDFTTLTSLDPMSGSRPPLLNEL